MNVLLRSAIWLPAATALVVGGCNDNDRERLIDANIIPPPVADASVVVIADAMVDAPVDAAVQPVTGFAVRRLLSDRTGVARHVDPALVNAWGLAMDARSFWIASNGSGRVLVVAPDGSPSKFSPPASALTLSPGITGIVSNPTTAFRIGPSNRPVPAKMLVASEDGRIFGINPAGTPQVVIDRSAVGASYKGLAIFTTSTGAIRLAAADFHNGRIDVWDARFQPIATVIIVDPGLRAGLAPFNIVAIDQNLYVTYAVQNATKDDDVAGVGNGRIDVFDLEGGFVKVLLDGGQLNAPWGVVTATPDFGGDTQGKLIVGNFGDGKLLAIDPATGTSTSLTMLNGQDLVLRGLWGLMFGNGIVGSTNELFAASGPNDEKDGLFSKIVLTTSK